MALAKDVIPVMNLITDRLLVPKTDARHRLTLSALHGVDDDDEPQVVTVEFRQHNQLS